jgi:chorismate mutase
LSVRGVRGAIVVPEDTTTELHAATGKLVSELLRRNQFGTDDIVSIIFTVTPDLHSAFPAEAARGLGLTHVPLLCAQEIGVDGAMERVIRVLMHVNTDAGQAEVQHVYLDGAESLRDDLS